MVIARLVHLGGRSGTAGLPHRIARCSSYSAVMCLRSLNAGMGSHVYGDACLGCLKRDVLAALSGNRLAELVANGAIAVFTTSMYLLVSIRVEFSLLERASTVSTRRLAGRHRGIQPGPRHHSQVRALASCGAIHSPSSGCGHGVCFSAHCRAVSAC